VLKDLVVMTLAEGSFTHLPDMPIQRTVVLILLVTPLDWTLSFLPGRIMDPLVFGVITALFEYFRAILALDQLALVASMVLL
jgi:hypothetical protein